MNRRQILALDVLLNPGKEAEVTKLLYECKGPEKDWIVSTAIRDLWVRVIEPTLVFVEGLGVGVDELDETKHPEILEKTNEFLRTIMHTRDFGKLSAMIAVIESAKQVCVEMAFDEILSTTEEG